MMKPFDERELAVAPKERALHSIRAVMARTTDAVWQADPSGQVTCVTECRPSVRSAAGDLDETEVARIEQLWRKSARIVERFAAVYHVRDPGGAARTFLIRAVPVLDERDAVQYWAGIVAETDGLAEPDTRFISEAAALLSSSLNRTTILNRLAQASIERFCDLCCIHTFADDGSVVGESMADRRVKANVSPEILAEAAQEAVRARVPVLLLSAALRDPSGKKMQALLDAAQARSMIVVPLFIGSTCIGSLTFAESERAISFATRDLDVAVVVARQAAMALENIKTFEREQHITERLRFLARVTEPLFTTLDQTKMLELLLRSFAQDFADYGFAGKLLDGRLSIIATTGTKARLRDAAKREILQALRERRSICYSDTPEFGSRHRLKAGPLYETDPPRSWMMTPLFVGDTTFGALVCASNARSYDPGEAELFEEIGRRVSLALDHAESFARERQLIQTLQQATLPTRLAEVQGATLSAVYRPAASEVQVGGDWYDAFDLDEHRVLLTVGDVTGHGLEASIVMGKLRHAINVVAMYDSDPVRILDAAERVLLRRYPAAVATAFVAIFDSRNQTITYANAGHPYPLLRSNDGSLQELRADGLPIGLRFAAQRAHAISKRVNDAALLAFYTDGLTEATHDMIAGERRLREALETDAIFYVGNPAGFLENFCLDAPSLDDVAILLLNFVDSKRWTFDSSDWRAARLVRREFLSAIASVAEPGSDYKAAELIFGELAANVAQHAGGPIEIALAWRDGVAVLHVVDRGEGYTAGKRIEADLLTEHGRGLWLVQRLGAQLDVELLPGYGTHVRATLPIRRIPSP